MQFEELTFHSFGSKAILFKNKWLFVSGGGVGGTTPNKNTLTLYEISIDYNPKLILKIDLKKEYTDHGMLLYKHQTNRKKTRKNTGIKNIDIIAHQSVSLNIFTNINTKNYKFINNYVVVV